MKKYGILSAFLFILFSSVASYGMVDATIFGNTFVRGTGTPVTEYSTFDGFGGGTAVIRLTNGGTEDSDTERVSSSVVSLNGNVIFDSSNFNQKVSSLDAVVTLNEGENTLAVLLKSKPGGQVKIEIVKEVDAEAAGVIGPDGGVVEVTDPNSNLLGVIVNVPQSALNEDTIVSIKKVDIFIALPQGTVTGSPAIDLGPDGTLFNNNIQITIPYDDADNDGIVDYTGDSEDDISCVLWDDTNQTWIAINIISQDTQNNTITVETNHFTWLVLISKCVPRDDVVIFTIDGLSLGKTIFVDYSQCPIIDIWGLLPRKKYLNEAIYKDMNLGLNKCDVIPYTWSGNAHDTPDVMSNLITTLENEYNNADDGGKKFILVTHSWGTRLGSLALRYSGLVVPDLFITLSDPSASNSVDDTMYTNTSFFPILEIPVSEMHFKIDNFVTNIEQETSDAMDMEGVQEHYLQAEKWINYWDVGDIFSGPLDLNSLDANWEDRTVRGDTVRTFGTTTEVHAITSLSKDKWEKFLLQYDVVEEGKEFRDKVEADIKAIIDCHKPVYQDDFEDGVIDTSLWVVGGSNGGVWSCGAGSGQWFNEENIAADGYLQARATTPISGLSWGSQAWTRTVHDFNDGKDWIINFKWEPDIKTVGQWHADYHLIEITDGRTDWTFCLYTHPQSNILPGTQQLYLGNGQDFSPTTWSIVIDASASEATLYEGPNGTGTIHSTKQLGNGDAWYVRFITTTATSTGYPAKDCRINLYDFTATEN